LKRLASFGVAFLFAAVVGVSIGSLTAEADLRPCQWEPDDLQYYWVCDDPACEGFRYPHGFYECGSHIETGQKCECYLLECGKWCGVWLPPDPGPQ